MLYTDREMRSVTQIAYIDMADAYRQATYGNDSGEGVTLNEIYDNLPEESQKKLDEIGLTDEQMANWKIVGVHDTNDSNGFYGCVVETAPNRAVVGFRGSEAMDTLSNVQNDWVNADLKLLNSTETNQQAEVRAFMEQNQDMLNNYEYLATTGHSLGGNLAEYFTIVSGEYGLDDNIVQCMSLDGPGFSEEFIERYKAEIARMSHLMDHPRWSFVGTMLNDLPGVNYRYVSASNKGDDKCNPVTRHDTKYLDYYGDSFAEAEQDWLSSITSVITEGIDHLPSPIGDITISVVSSVWVSVMWLKETVFDEDGNITLAGMGIISFATLLISNIGVTPILVTVTSAVIALLSVIVVAYVYETINDFVHSVADAFVNILKDVYDWAKENIDALRYEIGQLLNRVSEWFNKTFNAGYRYATNNTNIKVDTAKLRNYADRLESVNRRICALDRRLDSLYYKVGLLDLWNLMQADILTGYSWRINRCVNYLNETASDFESAEYEILSKL